MLLLKPGGCICPVKYAHIQHPWLMAHEDGKLISTMNNLLTGPDRSFSALFAMIVHTLPLSH